MNLIHLIEKKKLGGEFLRAELELFISGVVTETIPNYQISALLMAIYFKGLSENEIYDLTDLMLHSGKNLRFDFPIIWDKHSTGGVGDKVSIILAPILASFGIRVPMISGRCLGHTGGTIDKLESIPGFSAEQPVERLDGLLEKSGFFIITQSNEIAPADRRLYALRDVTGTVDSIPLIVASILSKKFAVNINGLLLDIKCGKGAFMKDLKQARTLSRLARKIGSRFGKNINVVITRMDQPLGRMVGNSLEIIESIEFLKGKFEPDLKELIFEMVDLVLQETGIEGDVDEMIRSGQPLESLRSAIIEQGGDGRVIEDYSLLGRAVVSCEIRADDDGWISEIDGYKVGRLLVEIGGGRKKTTDRIDHRVGFEFRKKVGDRVKRGDIVCIAHLQDEDQVSILNSFQFIQIRQKQVSVEPIFFDVS